MEASLQMTSDDEHEGFSIASYAPRVIDISTDSIPDHVTAFTSHYMVPNTCRLAQGKDKLYCDDEDHVLRYVAFDSTGRRLNIDATIDDSYLSLSTDLSVAIDSSAVLSVFIGDESATASAVEGLEWMVGTDGEASISEEELQEEEVALNQTAYPTPPNLRGEPGLDPLPIDSQRPASIAPQFASFWSRPAFVGVPSNYRYCPTSCRPKARHDYCTRPAVNRFGWASFHGPCARHDMMISSIAASSRTRSDKISARFAGDRRFLVHLRQNCGNAYHSAWHHGLRGACYGVAAAYFGAVTPATLFWNGR